MLEILTERQMEDEDNREWTHGNKVCGGESERNSTYRKVERWWNYGRHISQSISESDKVRLTYWVAGLGLSLHLAYDKDGGGVQVKVNPEPGVTGTLWSA